MFLKKKYISVHCSYYGDNFGDTLFAVEMSNFLQNEGINKEDIVFPFSSKRAMEQSNVSNRGLWKFLRSSKIIFAGGGYFGEPSTGKLLWNLRFLKRHGFIILLSIIFNKEIIVTGVGVGPISYLFNRYLIKKLFNKASTVVVRDPDSLKYTQNYLGIEKCILGADPIINTAISKYDNLCKTKYKKTTIGIHLPMLHDHIVLNKVAKDLKVFQNDKNVDFIVFLDFFKPSFKNLVEDQLNLYGIDFKKYSYEGTESLEKFLCKLDGVITTKLHVGIVSTCFNVPAYSLYVHDKTPKYYNLINKSEWCVNFFEYNESSINNFLDFVYSKSRFEIPEEVFVKSKSNYSLISKWLKK